jgi:serine phosphatase RsbU (regulator of sigma subunit)
LLYTDGVNEARDSEGNFFSLEEPGAAALLGSPATAQALCDALVRMVLDHQGTTSQADDITLLAIKSG